MTPVPWRSPTVWAVPAVGLAALVMLAATGSNREVFAAINGWSRVTGPDIWPFFTVLGDTAVALALFLPFALRRPDILRALAVSALLATLFVHGFKPLVDEPRPPAVLAADQFTVIGKTLRTHSFPSGHTTTIFTAAALLWLHFASPAVRAAALVTALLVGLSRAVVGAHWPVDIAAGMAGGWLSACAGTAIARRWRFGLRPAMQALVVLIGAGCAIAALAGMETGYPTALPLERAVGAVALVGLGFELVARFKAGRDDKPDVA